MTDRTQQSDDEAGFDSPGTISPHPALVLVPDVSPDENVNRDPNTHSDASQGRAG